MNNTIMQWKYILTQHRKAILILASILLMILLVFIMNKRHLSDLRNSVTSVYEDRLVAEGYIFRLSKHIYEKRDRTHTDESTREMAQFDNKSIESLIKCYEATQLTPEERVHLDALKTHLIDLQLNENQFISSNSVHKSKALQAQLEDQYSMVLSDLDKLSQIQLAEGQKILDHSDQVIASSNLTLRLEISLMIILGLLFHMTQRFSKETKFTHSFKNLRTPITSNLN